MTDFEVTKLNVLANMARIEQLLSSDNIGKHNVTERMPWGKDCLVLNKKNVELRQRIKLLRKDTLALEKSFQES